MRTSQQPRMNQKSSPKARKPGVNKLKVVYVIPLTLWNGRVIHVTDSELSLMKMDPVPTGGTMLYSTNKAWYVEQDLKEIRKHLNI